MATQSVCVQVTCPVCGRPPQAPRCVGSHHGGPVYLVCGRHLPHPMMGTHAMSQASVAIATDLNDRLRINGDVALAKAAWRSHYRQLQTNHRRRLRRRRSKWRRVAEALAFALCLIVAAMWWQFATGWRGQRLATAE